MTRHLLNLLLAALVLAVVTVVAVAWEVGAFCWRMLKDLWATLRNIVDGLDDAIEQALGDD